MSDKPILEVRHLSKNFDANGVLKDVSFSMKEGEVIVVVGPSGCGKSTLLRCINGLERPDGGEILLDGQRIDTGADLVQVRRQVGMVFQSYDLFPHMDVLGNLTLGPVQALKRPKLEVEAEAEQALARVGLAEKAKSLPRQLSGGQKQRVALVRAMLMHPRLLLLDEITAALAGFGPRGHDHADRHPRDALRRGRGRPGAVPGGRAGAGGGPAEAVLPPPPDRARPAVPEHL